MDIIISKSTRDDKKYMAKINNKTIHFGSSIHSDYTKHKDEERKKNYINRHKKNEDWTDPNTAGFYAKNLLWNKPTLEQSIKDTNNKFKNIKLKFK